MAAALVEQRWLGGAGQPASCGRRPPTRRAGGSTGWPRPAVAALFCCLSAAPGMHGLIRCMPPLLNAAGLRRLPEADQQGAAWGAAAAAAHVGGPGAASRVAGTGGGLWISKCNWSRMQMEEAVASQKLTVLQCRRRCQSCRHIFACLTSGRRACCCCAAGPAAAVCGLREDRLFQGAVSPGPRLVLRPRRCVLAAVRSDAPEIMLLHGRTMLVLAAAPPAAAAAVLRVSALNAAVSALLALR